MNRVFVDTSVWYEAVDDQARHHRQAAAWLAGFEGRLVTSSAVLDETVSVVKRRMGHHVAEAVGQRLQDVDAVHMVAVEDGFRDEGWKRFRARPDKGYSLVDCTSFIVMERMGIRTAATLDKHFRQEGFEVVPG